jgi:hypothetical protein
MAETSPNGNTEFLLKLKKIEGINVFRLFSLFQSAAPRECSAEILRLHNYARCTTYSFFSNFGHCVCFQRIFNQLLDRFRLRLPTVLNFSGQPQIPRKLTTSRIPIPFRAECFVLACQRLMLNINCRHDTKSNFKKQ